MTTADKHNTPANMDAFYSGIDDAYHEGRAWFYVEVAQACARATAGKGDLNVLDVGCGRGDQLRHLRSWMGARIQSAKGIDISPVAIKLAALREPWAEFVTMDVIRPRLDWRFDLVVCSQVLEHILDANRALESMIAMLKPGGVLVLTVPDGAMDTYGGHHHFWTLDGFAELLRPYGGTATRLTKDHLLGEARK
jgi:2-polyprenyl-3-methyl-5-hydroxy-6-metoxy-1,4-benzoquinol methylase